VDVTKARTQNANVTAWAQKVRKSKNVF